VTSEDVPFEALGARRFQLFCQSLLSYEQPRLQAFPLGQPDGGRDAVVLHGDGEALVFQVKFVERPDYLRDPAAWLRRVLKHELPKIRQLTLRGGLRYCLVTNVPGSGHLGTGSIDRADAVLEELLPVPGQVLWRSDLIARLAKHHELKWAYRELLTGQDVFDELVVSQLSEDRNRRRDAIHAALATQFALDRTVRFKQVDLHNDLFELFIDAPMEAQVDDDLLAAARELGIDIGPSDTAATSLLGKKATTKGEFRRCVVEGAPGQGKSTLAQYVCQVHRLRLIGREADAPEIWARHREGVLRLPFKADLNELATFLAGADPFESVPGWGGVPADWPRTLEGFMALQVRRYSGGARFDVSDLLALARDNPLLLVLDGLDEVADVDDRGDVVKAVETGLTALEAVSASLQVIVTSRPAAFANSPGFSPDLFGYAALGSLTPELIIDYGKRWVRARRLPDEEAAEVMGVLRERLGEAHMRELARNPMQLAILLSLIAAKGESLPDRRTELYHDYMNLFFDRESAKSRVVRMHRKLLFGLHGELAWRLHGAAERASEGGSIGLEDLRKLVGRYVGQQGADADLTDALFQGVVERIVAIVATKQERFEFEVQPLREFFAAHHLYATGQVSQFSVRRPGTRADRFAALARNAFWLNVLRF
jgi:hypothetical protein